MNTSFNVNDIVVCIDNQETNLLLNKHYKIFSITTDSDPRIHQNYMVLLVLYEDTKHGYFSRRFIKLKDIRKDKLKQLYKNGIQ